VTSDPQARVVERAGDSNPGRRRTSNEDRLLSVAPLFVVADGIGGQRGGEVAAALVVEVFREKGVLYCEKDVDTGLRALVDEANTLIYEKAQKDKRYKGMGTTVTAALVHDDCVTLAHVGDSRAYRLRDGALAQLTDDHSYVAELVRMGALTPEEADQHPQKSAISRAIGRDPAVEPDIHSHPVRDGDVMLLCSDGLTKMVSEADIAASLAVPGALDDSSERLIAAANAHGGEDNITVCLFRLSLPEEDGGRNRTSVIDLSVIARSATAKRKQL
jgi:PPM family protein phosphatase